jgi:DNA-binding transcriptional regulator YhcF (GntR family)
VPDRSAQAAVLGRPGDAQEPGGREDLAELPGQLQIAGIVGECSEKSLRKVSPDEGPSAERRGQLRQPRLAEVVAGALRERIVDEERGDGDLLPKQDELIEEFRISRPTLREALRILENEGLLTVRRGSVGGSVIQVPTAAASAYTFGLVLQSRRATISDLASAIKQIEPISASLCATREDRAREVVPALRANLKQTEAATSDGPQFTALARQRYGVTC